MCMIQLTLKINKININNIFFLEIVHFEQQSHYLLLFEKSKLLNIINSVNNLSRFS